MLRLRYARAGASTRSQNTSTPPSGRRGAASRRRRRRPRAAHHRRCRMSTTPRASIRSRSAGSTSSAGAGRLRRRARCARRTCGPGSELAAHREGRGGDRRLGRPSGPRPIDGTIERRGRPRANRSMGLVGRCWPWLQPLDWSPLPGGTGPRPRTRSSVGRPSTSRSSGPARVSPPPRACSSRHARATGSSTRSRVGDGWLTVVDVQDDGTVSLWMTPQEVRAGEDGRCGGADDYAGKERVYFLVADAPVERDAEVAVRSLRTAARGPRCPARNRRHPAVASWP